MTIGILLLLVGGATLDSFTTKYIYGVITKLNEFVLDSGEMGAVFLAAMLFVFTICGIPCTLFIVGGGFAFSEEYGSMGVPISVGVGFVGCYCASLVGFLISRYLLRDYFRAYIRQHNLRIVRAIDIAMKREGIKFAIVMRMVPYCPGPVFNYMAGVTSMEFVNFVAGGVGMLPWLIISSLVGAGLNSIDDAANGNSDEGINPTLNLAIIGIAIVTTIASTLMITMYARKALKEIQDEEVEGNGRVSESSILFSVDLIGDEAERRRRLIAMMAGEGGAGGGEYDATRDSSSTIVDV